MQVHIVPVLEDNYSYIVINKINQVLLVDPVEPSVVMKALDRLNRSVSNVKMVLTTHHHWDHSGGNDELAKLKKDIVFLAGDNRSAKTTNVVEDEESVDFGELKIKCLLTKGHTQSHICYFIEDNQEGGEKLVFTGDTLFIGGCGRFFEGSPEDMYNSLFNKLKKLPDETKVYCGHEYTRKNLQFAKSIDKENKDLDNKIKETENQTITVPSTIEEEKKYNPFMRVDQKEFRNQFKTLTSIETMAKLRELKDKF